MPERVQLSRAKGWRMPPNTVKVDRTSKWGNPYRVVAEPRHKWVRPTFRVECDATIPGGEGDTIHLATELTRAEALGRSITFFREWAARWDNEKMNVEDLRGLNLACWCQPGAPCHADVLLELANR